MLIATPARAQDVGLPLGTRPEAPQVEDLDGNVVDLASIVGSKPAILEFWASWCELCQALSPRFRAAFEEYGDRVEFLTVAVGVNQTPRSVKRHLESEPIGGRVIWDGQGRAVRAFEAPGTSYVVVLNASGAVVYTGSGADQDIAAAVAKALQ